MERAIAVRKLSKLLGKSLGYRVNERAPTPDEKAEAKMTKHTPGPWQAVTSPHSQRTVLMPDDTVAIRAAQGGTVAFLYVTNFDMDGKIDAANARLIAAAPDLLAALKAVDTDGRDAYPEYDDCEAGDVIIPSHVWDMISTAIAKAEGK